MDVPVQVGLRSMVALLVPEDILNLHRAPPLPIKIHYVNLPKTDNSLLFNHFMIIVAAARPARTARIYDRRRQLVTATS